MARSAGCKSQMEASFGLQLPSIGNDGFLKCVPIAIPKQVTTKGLVGNNLPDRSTRLVPMSAKSAQPGGQVLLPLAPSGSAYSDDDGPLFDDEDDDESNNMEANTGTDGDPDETMLADFRQYCQDARKFEPFTTRYVKAIGLMKALRQTKASLDTYDDIMEWHLKAIGELHPWESASGSSDFISRKVFFEFLRKRYNRTKNYNNLTRIILPSSKACVNIVWTDAKECIKSILTDPRIKANDYIFNGNNPFAPPENLNYVGDLHTGKAYMETYKRLITDPTRQILLPCPLYIDGAATGQFSDHELVPVKISLGIFTRKARNQPHMWRSLGFIPPVSKEKSRGRRLLIESGHLDAVRAVHEAHQNEGLLTGEEAIPAQDFHTMLDKVLESFVEIQNKGFKWDLFYNNTIYRDVEFIPFVPFIKCDTDEADKLCGSYTFRGKHVAQLCRYCQCPTKKSDDFRADYPSKTKPQIQALVNQGNMVRLKALSQQYIDNATYKLRFGLHNSQGVHGATPLEMLHALLLGIFKYLRDEFFRRLGEKSKLATDFDALAKLVGGMLSRQSCRNKPKTKFSNGIRKGKLMAKEYTGVLLVMLVVLRTQIGNDLVAQRSKEFGPTFLADWIMVIETLLQWEEWMKKDIIYKKHIRAARDKHRYIMYLIKKVAQRTKGMGLKITKFHAILHLANDILYFGVPMEVDTGVNESHHKPNIQAAHLTQKDRKTFEIQTANRIEEMDLLELAAEEIAGRALWHYFDGYDEPLVEPTEQDHEPVTGGAAFRVGKGPNGVPTITSVRKDKGKSARFMMEEALLYFVNGLQDAVKDHYEEVLLFTFHKRKGQIFRSSANFRGGVWRDWVYVDWGRDGLLPNKIWGFVNLMQIPPNKHIKYGGLSRVTPGIYAIVESAKFVEPDDNTDLVFTLETDCHFVDGKVEGLKFYLADVEAFAEPAIVIPDVGGSPNRYLCLHNRSEWAKLFEMWLDDPSDLWEDVSDASSSSEDDDGFDEGQSSSDDECEGESDEEGAANNSEDEENDSEDEENDSDSN